MKEMLKNHMLKHIDKAVEVAVYVFRYDIKSLIILPYVSKPKITLVYDKEVLFVIELRQHPLSPKTITTHFGGPFAEFIDYIPM